MTTLHIYIYIARQANNIFKITKKCHFDLTAYTYNFPNFILIQQQTWQQFGDLKLQAQMIC